MIRRCFLVLFCVYDCFGCSVAPPRAEKYFDREAPVAALKGFVYSVETRQWEYAYNSLSSTSRNEISPLQFRAAILVLNDPSGQVPVWDLIVNSLYRKKEMKTVEEEQSARIRVLSRVQQPGKPVLYARRWIFLTKEQDEWFLDLVETMRNMPLGNLPGQKSRS